MSNDHEPPDWLTDERKQNMAQHVQNNLDAWIWEKSRYIETLQKMREEAIALSKRGLAILEKVEQEVTEKDDWREKDDA